MKTLQAAKLGLAAAAAGALVSAGCGAPAAPRTRPGATDERPPAGSGAPAAATAAVPPAGASTRGNEKAHAAPDCPDLSNVEPSTLPPLPEGPHRPLFEAVWDLVRRKHFDPTLGCVDWVGMWERYGPKVVTAPQAATAHRLIREMLATLGQSHFALIADTGEDEGGSRDGDLPFTLRWVEGRAVVTESRAPEIPLGSEVRTVGKEDVASAVAAAEAAPDGMGTPAFRIRRALDRVRECRVGTRAPVTFVPPGDGAARRPRTADVTCAAPEGESVSLGHLHNVPTRVTHRLLPGKTGYLAFNVWMLPMLPRIEAALEDLRRAGARAVVLDLRGNPGGVGPMSVPVARMFLRNGGSLGTLRFRDFEQTFQVAPNPEAFDGPLRILVDEATASTSEIFAVGMQALGRARVVCPGTSAGAALPSLIESLPTGARLQFVVGAYHAPDGRVAEGRGVVCDLVVTEHAADFEQGRDPVLEAALADLPPRNGSKKGTMP